MSRPLLIATLLLAALTTGCATQLERGLEADLARQERRLAPERTSQVEDGPPARFDGRLETYVAYALKHSSALRARFDEWRASTHRIAQERRLPEPTFTYGLYLSRVETRVGPQRHRFSLTQAFPWPTALTAGVDAASLEAKSAERRFDAAALQVVRRVATAYWKLWIIAQQRKVEGDQLKILEYLFESARARLETGKSGLADLGQIQLSSSRLTDGLAGLDERQRAAEAELIAALGAPPSTEIRIADEPPPLLLPAEEESALRAALAAHPEIESYGLLADSRTERADDAAAEGYPSFLVGLDYIETGPASVAGVDESGKDAVILRLGVSIPLWWNVYGAERDQAAAEGAAFRAKQAASLDEAQADLAESLAAIRDAVRQVRLYRNTLLPQAETVYGSVLGEYQTGTATLAQVVLAQRDLLELQRGLFRAQADHAVAWARLEAIVGRSVRAKEVT
jgi:outer membrane protein TolC